MATRDLARTIVEGGRHRQSSSDRRWANRSDRRLRFGPEGEVVAGRERGTAWKFFHDRPNPLTRWMDRQVGRGWRNVLRDLDRIADRQTVKGRHLREHALGLVRVDDHDRSWGRRWFFVDARGILRRGRRD